MPADIKIPGFGEVDRKKALIIGGGVAAVAVVLVIRQRKNAAAAAAAAAVPSTDTTDSGDDTATDPSIDPLTGIPYADEVDEADSADEFDSGGNGAVNSADDYDAAGYPVGSAADLAWQAQQEGIATTPTSAAASNGITTNEQWIEAAEAQMGDTSTVSAALSKVLGGLPVTTAQDQIFLEAVGILGSPPGGYPTPNITDTSAQPAAGTAGATVSVPNVVGQRANPAIAALQKAGFNYHIGTARNPKSEYEVTSQTPGGGAKAAKGSTVDLGLKVV